MFCSGTLTAPAALRRMQVAKFCSCVKRSKWYFLQQHVLRVSTWFPLYNHVIQLLTSCPFIYLKTFLPSDSRESAANPLQSSAAAEQLSMQQGTSVPLALCCQRRQCVTAIRPLRTASWKCHYAVFFPAVQEQRGEKRHSENWLVHTGGLFVGCADLASAPSGGAWNKSFAGGNALELPTQDIYFVVLWCCNCQWGDGIGCWRPGILPLKNWWSGRTIFCTHTISHQDCA